MKYIFLAIILLCVTILIYIQFFNKASLKEGLTFEEQKKNLIDQDKYYDYRKFPQTVQGG